MGPWTLTLSSRLLGLAHQTHLCIQVRSDGPICFAARVLIDQSCGHRVAPHPCHKVSSRDSTGSGEHVSCVAQDKPATSHLWVLLSNQARAPQSPPAALPLPNLDVSY